jgi:hypothetical protein
MPSGDFLDLQNNLAVLAGRDTAADLDGDLALCKQVINEALLEVYRPVDGRYPEWARRTVVLNYRAPLAINIGVTNGSRIVTGYAFPNDALGSLVQIGAAFYRYAGSQSLGTSVLIFGAGTTNANGVYAYTNPTTYTAETGYTAVRVTSGLDVYWEIRDAGSPYAVRYKTANLGFGDSNALVDAVFLVGQPGTSGDGPAPSVSDKRYYLVEPFNQATGPYAATLHHVSQPLPADVAEVVGGVEWQGRGLLSPMTDRETDVGYRSVALPDYHPDYGAGFWGTYSRGVRGTAYPQGDLLFYYLETDSLLEGADVLRRMNIVPMPRESANVAFRANVVPVELVADTDRPKIVADLVTRCLLPIAREIWGITYKKYTGDNRDALIRQADKARTILTGMAKPQKRFSGRARAGC